MEFTKSPRKNHEFPNFPFPFFPIAFRFPFLPFPFLPFPFLPFPFFPFPFYPDPALNRPVESAGRPPALSPPAPPDSSDMMKAKTQCYILPRIIEGLIQQNKNHSAKHKSILCNIPANSVQTQRCYFKNKLNCRAIVMSRQQYVSHNGPYAAPT